MSCSGAGSQILCQAMQTTLCKKEKLKKTSKLPKMSNCAFNDQSRVQCFKVTLVTTKHLKLNGAFRK